MLEKWECLGAPGPLGLPGPSGTLWDTPRPLSTSGTLQDLQNPLGHQVSPWDDQYSLGSGACKRFLRNNKYLFLYLRNCNFSIVKFSKSSALGQQFV